MPSKKKKYNTRFPASRIKKIMQTDEEIGKVAQAVPIIISRTLELFVESLLRQSMHITQSRNAKTLTPSHMKQCILAESRFDFLKDLVKNVPDASVQEDNENNEALENAEALDYSMAKEEEGEDEVEVVEEKVPVANYYTDQLDSGGISARTPVIQFNPKYNPHEVGAMVNDKHQTHPPLRTYTPTSPYPLPPPQAPKINFSIEHLVSSSSNISTGHISSTTTASTAINHQSTSASADVSSTPHLHLDFSHLAPMLAAAAAPAHVSGVKLDEEGATHVPVLQMLNRMGSGESEGYTNKNDGDSGPSSSVSSGFSFPVPPLVPLTQPYAIPAQNTGDSLYIDEDYDN